MSVLELDDPWGLVWGFVLVVWDSSCIPYSREKNHRVMLDLVLDMVLDMGLVWDSSYIPRSKKKNHRVMLDMMWGMVWVWDCYSSYIPRSREKNHRVVVIVISQGTLRMLISAAGQGNRIVVSVEVLRCIAISIVRTAVSM